MVYEGEDVRFECLVSRDEAPFVQWKLQDVPLQDNEMNVIKSEGQLHSLTLRGVTMADSGTVTFSVGNHTSTASLTVKGKKPVMMWLVFQEQDSTPFSILFNPWMSFPSSSSSSFSSIPSSFWCSVCVLLLVV